MSVTATDLVRNGLQPVKTAVTWSVDESVFCGSPRKDARLCSCETQRNNAVCVRKGIRSEMWCRDCHREVDVKSSSGAGVACPQCGRLLAGVPKHNDSIRHAREILERWQSTDLFERISTTGPLTTLKQQDRAPLLNIPLGPSYATATASPVTKIDSVSLDAPEFPPILPEPLPSKLGQEVWEFLVAPKPILATTAPAADELAWEESPPNGPLPSSIARAPSGHAKATHLSNSHEVSSELEHPRAAGSSTPAKAASQVLLGPSGHQEIDDVLSDAAVSWELAPFDQSAGLESPSLELPESRAAQNAHASVETVAQKQPTVESSLRSETTAKGIAETESPPNASGVSNPGRDFPSRPAASVAETLPFVERRTILGTVDPTISAQLVHAASSVPMSSTAILPKSLSGLIEPAETANHPQLNESEATKKKERSPMRRPPLHRRFQLERPVTASSAGSNTVTRKLRLDQIGGTDEATAAQSAEAAASSVAPETKIVSNSPKPSRRFRIDSAEGTSEVTGTDGRRKRTQTPPKQRYIDDAHDSQLRGPHFEISAPKRSNLTSMTGQFLAYMGVLGLTIGTAMVIYGHFGGYSEYTPTGWLVTTVAQMLLFLGVINLVSGGIEQNNDDVSRRINTLGEQLLRIEQVTSEAMRGPKLPAHLYADPESEVTESTREKVAAIRE